MRLGLSFLFLFSFSASVSASDRVDYVRDIKPILVEKCYSCHGAWKQKSRLRVETIALLKQGGRNGPAVVPGKPAESLLLSRMSGEDGEEIMPPPGEGEKLSSQQLALVKQWIEQGAIGPEEAPPPDPREHWAFQPPVKAAIPLPGFTNPIDTFLAVEHQKRGLIPEPEADRRTLLRRVYIDLIGIPPTREEMNSFLEDASPFAYEAVVEKLLTSPRHSERWARHWMDIWRYSDWSGENNNQVRGSPKHVWRWRDWIIDSIENDKGYDRMLTEMLAGDEVAPHNPEILRATGFLARNYYKFNRNVWLDDTVEHTVKAFMGLTIGCAKCHDHKFDPLSSHDYYRFRAIFEPHQVRTDMVGSQRNLDKDGLVRVYDRDLRAPTYFFARGDETQADKNHPLPPSVPDIFQVSLNEKPVAVSPPQTALAALIGNTAARLPDVSSGRRLALAHWLTSADNPLTARVAVNHIWLRHIGTSLVEDVADFGLRSPRPRHAKLLDWLAVEFRESGWSMKHLHRLIVTSQLYRRQSESRTNHPANAKADPQNAWLWRMNARRLEAEAVRDSVLATAGTLDTRRGGPEIPLTESERSYRRGLYFRHAHERQIKFLEVFDSPSPLECYRRSSTVVPQQALALWNGPFVMDQARTLSESLSQQAQSDEEFISLAFETILNRTPTSAEQSRCRDFLEEQGARARENLVHVLYNHTEFVTVR